MMFLEQYKTLKATIPLGFTIILSLLFYSTLASAAVITVCSSGCDSTTVQGGINLASNYDEVRITDSIEFNESVVVNRTGITLTSNTTTRPTVFSDFNHTIYITADNVTVRNLTIIHNSSTGWLYAIYADSRTNVTIANNTVSNTASVNDGYGVYFTSTTNSTIANNTINASGDDSHHGIYLLSNSDSNNITANTITTSGVNTFGLTYGIYFDSSSSNTVSSNNITTGGGSDNPGIYIFSSSNSNNITSNIISTSGTGGLGGNPGIWTSSSSTNTISNNIITTSGPSSTNFGIEISGGSSNTVQNNTITTSGTNTLNDGIIVSGAGSSTTVQFNTITTGGTTNNHGIKVEGGTKSVTVQSNTITTSGTGGNNYGIFFENSNGTVTDNTITTGGTTNNHGIRVDVTDGASSSSIFRSNNITADSTGGNNHGVFLSAVNNNTFYDNIITATDGNDVFLRDGAARDTNYFVNVSFNKSDIFGDVVGDLIKLFVQYRLDVTIQDDGGSPLNAALVIGNDTDSQPNSENPTSNFSDTTNSSGQIQTRIITEFLANSTHNGTSGYVYFTNYTINASLEGYSNASIVVNLTESKSLIITLTNLNNVCNLNMDTCYQTIQEAINSANDYDRISIINDIIEYNESVVVNVTGITLFANTSMFPVVFSDFNHTIYITADNVTIRNLTIIHNSSTNNLYSVYVDSRNNITITNNTINNTGSGNFGYGVSFTATNSSIVENNTINTAGGFNNYGVYLTSNSDSNTLQQNTISTSGTNDNYGIYIVSSSDSTLSDNNITTSGTSSGNYGIFLQSSSNSTLSDNNITTSSSAGSNYGIRLFSSSNSTVSDNTISTNGTSSSYGIYLQSSSNSNTVQSNNITTGGGNNNYGVYLTSNSDSNTFQQNTITTDGISSNYGIRLDSSPDSNTFQQNTISTGGTGATNYGILLDSSSNSNTFQQNTISTGGTSSNYGIYFFSSSDNNVFRSNNVTADSTGGSNHGIYIDDSNNNTFYDDIITATDGNDVHLVDGAAGDTNYFVNVSFNKSDIFGDVVGDLIKLFVQYRLDVTIQDDGGSPLNAALVIGNDTDSQPNSENPTSNFSDTSNSTGQISTQILTEFMANSTYNGTSGYLYFTNYIIAASKSGFNSASKNINLTSSQATTITLCCTPEPAAQAAETPSSGFTSSPSPQQNKINLTIPALSPGIEKKLYIALANIPLSEITLKTLNTVTNVKITVEKIIESSIPTTIPTIASTQPASVVNSYLNIETENIQDEDIDEATIKFKVSKQWIADNSINESTIALQRYTDQWNSLPTVKVSGDDNNIYFEAITPGFSYFAITGQSILLTVPVIPELPTPAEEEIPPPEVEPTAEIIKPITIDYSLLQPILIVVAILAIAGVIVYRIKYIGIKKVEARRKKIRKK